MTKHFNGKMIIFQTNGGGIVGYSILIKVKLNLYLIAYTKINSKWRKNLKLKHKHKNDFQGKKIFMIWSLTKFDKFDTKTREQLTFGLQKIKIYAIQKTLMEMERQATH